MQVLLVLWVWLAGLACLKGLASLIGLDGTTKYASKYCWACHVSLAGQAIHVGQVGLAGLASLAGWSERSL